MKKYLIFVILLLAGFALGGCDWFNNTTSTATSTQTTTAATTTTTGTTTEITTIINDVITLVLSGGQDTVEINTDWIDAGAIILINDEPYNMATTDIVDESTLGLYSIEYTYTYEEELYSIVRYVIVVDQTTPVITLSLGVDTVQINSSWTDAGATVTDNSGEELIVVVTGTVDTSATGTYVISYTATDSSGNTTTVLRYVTVIN